MTNLELNDLVGLAVSTVAYMAFFAKVMRASRFGRSERVGLSVMALFFALFPILNEPLVIYFRGLLGDLSVAKLSQIAGSLGGSAP